MASKEHILTLRRYILLSFVLLFNMYVHASLTVESREVEMSNDSLIIDSLNYDSPILSPNTTEEPYSPLDIYLPPSPQSSALARYGEYPVNMAAGLPNISIPLYEIKIGEFSLPISISYHASGIKVDDVASTVGLGWVLNAGGMISRSVLGTPDLRFFDPENHYDKYKYYSYANVRQLFSDVRNNNDIIFNEIFEKGINSFYDTESDRYIYNFGDKAGVFRYSYTDSCYFTLNGDPILVEATGGEESAITITNTDGVRYIFAEREKSGIANYESGEIPYITAWYVTEIDTPYGQLHFTYSTETAHSNFTTVSEMFSVGDYITDMEQSQHPGQRTVHFKQKTILRYDVPILNSIQWTGGSIVFSYAEDREDIATHRITSMKVYDTQGVLKKTVLFDCAYLGTQPRNKRMLLSSLSLSDEGTYSFSYDNMSLPNYMQDGMTEPPFEQCYKDYWGYYNGRPSRCYVPKSLLDTERYGAWSSSTGADRTPSSLHSQAGMLKSITYPTGGTTAFSYELNRRYYSGSLELLGGHRIKSITNYASDGTEIGSKSYTYFYPERTHTDMNLYMTYTTSICNTYYDPDGMVRNLVVHESNINHYLSDPLLSPTSSMNSSVYYGLVSEQHADGSITDNFFDTYGVIHYIAPLSSITLQQQGYYNSGMLIGEVETDEDGHDLTTYKNLRGQKVLERRMPINNLSSYKQDTHYVYNDLGQFRYVISPEYQFAGYKAKYAYEYRYDERGRVVKKILPGCEFIQYWYDDADRMTFMQDATLRGKGLYRYYLYDKFGRLCVQGLCSDCNRSSAVNAVTYVAVGSGYCGTGYSVANASRITNHTLEIVNYYDEYDYLRLYPDKPLLNRDNNVCVTGLMTGEVNTTSNDETMVKSLYYDALGRSTEMRMYGLEGMFSTNTTEYTFDSNINKSVETIFPNNSISDTLACTTIYNYHSNSGLLTTKQLAIKYGNTERMQQIQQFVYDDIGRITSVGRGGSAGLVSYNYNLRGWQTDISGQGFEEHLYYTNGSGVPCYNGNISSLQWKAYGDEYMRGYKYTYDTWNRLTDAIYGERNFDKHHNRYDERVLEYSLNGNIRRLQRRGLKDDGQYGKIDNLSLSYDGNKLQTVHDDAAPVTSYESFDFKDGVSQEVEYTYNGAGALTSDSNKGISSIEYDNLNNPTEISFNNGNSTTYVYSPKGTKLQTRHSTIEYVPFISSEPGEELTTTIQREIITTNRYVGNCIFNGNGTVTYVFDGGYATIEAEGNTNIVFHYYTKDHLGSNRAVVNENGNIEQVTHYYPFGGIYGDASTQQSLQPYKYNGKEFNKDFELNLYDYGARWYDPIGSLAFTTMDPLCEDDCKVSPYAYCANNPVNAIDPDGRKKHNWLKGGSNNYDINNFNDDTNIINIWAHGLQRVIDGDAFGIEVLVVKNDEDNNKKYPFVRKIMDARDFSTVLNDASSEWRERTGEITIVMHSCATSVFIQTISKDPIFKDVVFIAPNNNVVVTSDSKKEYVKNVEIRNFVKKENGSNVRHKVIKRGLWYMIKNGNIVKKYDGRLTPGSRDFKY